MTERTHEMSTADLATARRDDDLRTGDGPDFDTLLGTADPTPDRAHEAAVQSPPTERVADPVDVGPPAAADSPVNGAATTGPLMPDQDREGRYRSFFERLLAT